METSSISNLLKRGPIPPGAIFMSNRATKEECFRRKLFGLPSSHAGLVKKIKAGMILFLFEYDKRYLYGIFEATSDGSTNIVPSAFVKSGKSFAAQARFRTISLCCPLNEAEFRCAIEENYYEPRKFRFELSPTQVRKLLQLFLSKKMNVDRSYFEGNGYASQSGIMTDIENPKVTPRDYETSGKEKSSPAIAYPYITHTSPHRIVNHLRRPTLPAVSSGVGIENPALPIVSSPLERVKTQLDYSYSSSREIFSPDQIMPNKEDQYPYIPTYSHRTLKSSFLDGSFPTHPVSYLDPVFNTTPRVSQPDMDNVPRRLIAHEPYYPTLVTPIEHSPSAKDIPTRVHDPVSTGFHHGGRHVDLPSSFPVKDFYPERETDYTITNGLARPDLTYLLNHNRELQRYSATGYEQDDMEMLEPDGRSMSDLEYDNSIVPEHIHHEGSSSKPCNKFDDSAIYHDGAYKERGSVFSRLSRLKSRPGRKTLAFNSELEDFMKEPVARKRKVVLRTAHDAEFWTGRWSAAKSNGSHNRPAALDDEEWREPSREGVDGRSAPPCEEAEEKNAAVALTPLNFKRRSESKKLVNQVELDNLVQEKEGEASSVKPKRKRLRRPSLGEENAQNQEPSDGKFSKPVQCLKDAACLVEKMKEDQPSDRQICVSDVTSDVEEMKQVPADEKYSESNQCLEDTTGGVKKIEEDPADRESGESDELLENVMENNERLLYERLEQQRDQKSCESDEVLQDAVSSVEKMKEDQNSDEADERRDESSRIIEKIEENLAGLNSNEPSERLQNAARGVDNMKESGGLLEDASRVIEKIKEYFASLTSSESGKCLRDAESAVEMIKQSLAFLNSNGSGESQQNPERVVEKIKEKVPDLNSDEPSQRLQDAVCGVEQMQEETSDQNSDESSECLQDASSVIEKMKARPGERLQNADQKASKPGERLEHWFLGEEKIKQDPEDQKADESYELLQDPARSVEEMKKEASDKKSDEPGQDLKDMDRGSENIKEKPADKKSNKSVKFIEDAVCGVESLGKKSDELAARFTDSVKETPANQRPCLSGEHQQDAVCSVVELNGSPSDQNSDEPGGSLDDADRVTENIKENPAGIKSCNSDEEHSSRTEKIRKNLADQRAIASGERLQDEFHCAKVKITDGEEYLPLLVGDREAMTVTTGPRRPSQGRRRAWLDC
ncbi:uncharacterized protein LOC144700048 [Wolffia australiana]